MCDNTFFSSQSMEPTIDLPRIPSKKGPISKMVNPLIFKSIGYEQGT